MRFLGGIYTPHELYQFIGSMMWLQFLGQKVKLGRYKD
jgi:hypothetical protein